MIRYWKKSGKKRKKHELEKKEQEEKILKEWRKKVSEKYKRENEKKEKLFKHKMLRDHWENNHHSRSKTQSKPPE